MAADLRALLRRRKLAVFVDLKIMARALRARTPVAVARRQAEYVFIDHQRVPLGFDEERFLASHLARVHTIRDGLGYSAPGSARRMPHPEQPLHLPFHLPAPAQHSARGGMDARLAVRRQVHSDGGA